MGIGESIGGIIGMCVGAYVFAATIPGALTAINGANTTGWTTAQTALWPIVGIIVLVASFTVFLPDRF